MGGWLQRGGTAVALPATGAPGSARGKLQVTMQSSSAEVTMMESQNRKRAPAWTEREGMSTLTGDRRCGDRCTGDRFSGSSEDLLNRLQIAFPSTLVLHQNEKRKVLLYLSRNAFQSPLSENSQCTVNLCLTD
ncbi:hypothetical protein UY3_00199 [Chelonia mydas]|uniref:Uncharacterized protein n=1 Tax=Chelonia mydas TaxID=8469 RepID=M7C2W4_CHEMY|nr:hypothetical protein UY3_00199 [Chelonia mydas]